MNELIKLLEYKDGKLYWKVNAAKNVKAGDLAGRIQKSGHRRIGFGGKGYLAHRIIFLMHHGYLPKLVDHHDNDPTNNRIENLRSANRSKNRMNSKVNSNNKLGIKGVSKIGNKYRVQIQANGQYKSIGYFDDVELAELVSIEARDKYHKEFANHG